MHKCQNCGTVMDRDENGARGIFLRALLDGALILSGDHAGNTIDVLQSIRQGSLLSPNRLACVKGSDPFFVVQSILTLGG